MGDEGGNGGPWAVKSRVAVSMDVGVESGEDSVAVKTGLGLMSEEEEEAVERRWRPVNAFDGLASW